METRDRSGAAGDIDAARPRRALWLDAGRGIAIAAMVIYHFAFDLRFFGFVDWPVESGTAWRTFAASIASTFLFLVGVSLVYAHGAGIRWRAFLRRLLLIAACAAVVTLATVFTMPAPIYFGILHAIATFSVLALPFLFLPPLVTIAAAAAVLAVPYVATSPVFAGPIFYPLGLAPVRPASLDYEPIFPWFAATLLGVAAGHMLPRGKPVAPFGVFRPLEFAGRYSLLIYIAHQPVLFAILIAVTQIM